MDLAPGRRDAVAQLPASGRLREMHLRIARRLETAGLEAAARARVLDANARALVHRLSVLGDEEHFEALHPSRTLLILLDDVEVADADVLATAALVESEHPPFRLRGDTSAVVPTPDSSGAELAEDLVGATAPVRLIALAERLDHARHLHLRDPSAWRAFHESIEAVYAPVAHRTHPRLARRYAWWLGTFRRRFLEPRQGR